MPLDLITCNSIGWKKAKRNTRELKCGDTLREQPWSLADTHALPVAEWHVPSRGTPDFSTVGPTALFTWLHVSTYPEARRGRWAQVHYSKEGLGVRLAWWGQRSAKQDSATHLSPPKTTSQINYQHSNPGFRGIEIKITFSLYRLGGPGTSESKPEM